MAYLSKLGIGLSVVFVLSFLALLTEICYILCRRKKPKHTLDGESDISGETYTTCCSKEFLHFFNCLKKSRMERNGAPTTIHPVDDDNAMEQPDELVKWQEIYGPSRVLFTIKEEEKEDLESEKSCSDRKSSIMHLIEEDNKSGEEEEEEMVMITVVGETETPYYTPFSSPSREVERGEDSVPESERCSVVEVKEMRRKASELEKRCFPVRVKLLT